MGIIQRQALRGTIIQFVGQILGGVLRLIMPLVGIVPGKLGLLILLDHISGLFASFLTLGFDQIMVKIFPKYRNEENGHFGFLAFGIFVSLVGIIIAFILFYFFSDSFLEEDQDLALYQRFSYLIFPLIFFRLIFINIDSYSRMLFNTVIGTFLENFLSKFIILFAVVALGLLWIDFDYFVYLYVISFCLPGVIVLVYAFLKTPKITWPKREAFGSHNQSEILNYAFFGILLGAASSFVFYIDSFMLGRLVSMDAVGYYSIFFMSARFILIPGRSVHRIATVILAEAWKENDKITIMDVYRKSCVNQLLIGAYLLGIGVMAIPDIMSLSPKYLPYVEYTDLFLILGIGFLIEMATGVNMAIIATSPIYKYNTYFIFAMAILAVVLNLSLIPTYGLTGCAIASLVSMSTVNLLRWFILVKRYNFQPFDNVFLKSIILSIVFLSACFLLNYEANVYVKLITNFLILSALFWLIVLKFNLSGDVSNLVKKIKAKYFT